MGLNTVSLDDKYELKEGRVLMSGLQALARLPMIQKEWDRAAGLNTAGFISGYRGSPIGELDFELWSAKEHLEKHDVLFQSGVNEDIAATAVWGTQQLENFSETKKFDGVFAMWYAKGPGVDRTGDVFKHANMAGTHPHGGALLVYGDDHNAKSSSIAHQCDQAFAANFIPCLYPASVHEYLEYGLKGWAMSRYTGLFIGFKGVNETLGQTGTVEVGLNPEMISIPDDGVFPEEDVHYKPRYHNPVRDDVVMKRYKIPLAYKFARANHLDKTLIAKSDKPALGLITAGKSYGDTREALKLLGIDDERARQLGISLNKVGMIWPLEPENIKEFVSGQDEVLVVEEKAAFVEDQVCKIIINDSQHARVIGKFDENGDFLLPADLLLDPLEIAFVISSRLEKLGRVDEELSAQVQKLVKVAEGNSLNIPPYLVRAPFYCSGCPHNTSLNIPEGSSAFAGIGCHGMAMFYNPGTMNVTQMGGEGSNWNGLAPFTETRHVFQNLGDGTYYHSGLIALRSAVAAGVNITYKILFNGVVGMTGGQPIDGPLSVADISQQVLHEGVKKVVVVSDEPEKYHGSSGLAPGTKVYHRSELDRVQREMREIEGVSVIIYEQGCAANKRRLRKRGKLEDPSKRIFINTAVCEGCGDCSVQSNCVSIQPVETEWGKKRRIEQSSCNKDYSCVKGFCPSFVTVLGGEIAKKAGVELSEDIFAGLPEPQQASIDQTYSIMIPGVGGEGVVTIGAILAMAAHVEGKQVSTFVMTGLAQKGGAVHSHLRIAADKDVIYASKIGKGESNLMLGCDIVSTVAQDCLNTVNPGKTYVLGNSRITPTAAFTKNSTAIGGFDSTDIVEQLVELVGDQNSSFVDATNLALGLTGNTLATNMFMTGFASQKGLLPISMEAINRAIELNGTAIPFNKLAYNLGRLAAHDMSTIDRLMAGKEALPTLKPLEKLEDVVSNRKSFLEDYQNAAYADDYASVVDFVVRKESELMPGHTDLAVAVARNLARLMAYKDEYEVARLYSSPAFAESLKDQFSGDIKLKFNLAPPLIARRDPQTGHLLKREFGTWVIPLFRLLAKLKVLRGTALDIMGYSQERKSERQLIADYKSRMQQISTELKPDNYQTAVELASLPDKIRGYGHVKKKNIEETRQEEQRLLERFKRGEDLLSTDQANAA